MSVVGIDAEVAYLVDGMIAEERRIGDLIHTVDRARSTRVRVVWKLVDRLIALAKDQPGVRWRVGDTVYWLEDARIRSAPSDIPPDRKISLRSSHADEGFRDHE